MTVPSVFFGEFVNDVADGDGGDDMFEHDEPFESDARKVDDDDDEFAEHDEDPWFGGWRLKSADGDGDGDVGEVHGGSFRLSLSQGCGVMEKEKGGEEGR